MGWVKALGKYTLENKRKTTWLRDIAVFAVIFFGISAWQGRHLLDSDGSVTIKATQLVSIQGNTQSISDPGKRTLVYFFAPWCNICKLSIGNLDYLQSEDLKVVRIALDYRSLEDVETFVSENEVTGTVLLGTSQQKQQFSVPGYPTYYLLDENSKVVASSFGYSSALGLKLKNFLAKN